MSEPSKYSSGDILRMQYNTVNSASTTGTGKWRTVWLIRKGTGAETDLGKPKDTAPGWWLFHGNDKKFFYFHRFGAARQIDVGEAITNADCPRLLIQNTMPEEQDETNIPPPTYSRPPSPASDDDEDGGRSRSRSRSPARA